MTNLEKVARLGTIGAHKHLTTKLHIERAQLVNELFEAGLLSKVDRLGFNNMIIGFDFVDPLYEQIFSAAFGKQLISHHNANHM